MNKKKQPTPFAAKVIRRSKGGSVAGITCTFIATGADCNVVTPVTMPGTPAGVRWVAAAVDCVDYEATGDGFIRADLLCPCESDNTYAKIDLAPGLTSFRGGSGSTATV